MKPVLVAGINGGFDFPGGTLAVWGSGSVWRCNNAGKDGGGLAHVGPTFTTAKAAAAAIGALLPPQVGDYWGDLEPEQWASIPVGSVVTRPVGVVGTATLWSSTKQADDQWFDACYCALYPDKGMSSFNKVTRIGPAPTATPEPDRSSWPVLVRDACGGLTLWWNDGTEAIDILGGFIYAWEPGDFGGRCGPFDSYPEAADAIHARLPDDVSPSEAADIERDAAAGAIAAIVRLGHTEHCAKRLAWGDGLCACQAHPCGDALENAERHRAERSEAEVARLTAALEGQTLANAPLRDALSTLRGRLAHALPGNPATDEAIVASVRKLVDRLGDQALRTEPPREPPRWEALEDAERHRAERAEAEVAHIRRVLGVAMVATAVLPQSEAMRALWEMVRLGCAPPPETP